MKTLLFRAGILLGALLLVAACGKPVPPPEPLRPTGSELRNYTVVVILFVLAIMAIVAGLDFVLHKLVLFTFAGS